MRTCRRCFNRHFVRVVCFQYDCPLQLTHTGFTPRPMEHIARLPQLLLASLRDAPWLWVAGALALLIALAAGVWFRRTRTRRRLKKVMRSLGPEALRNALVPDPVEGQVHVDFLVLSPAGILVIDVKDYRGMLFGGVSTDIWTQVVDGRSYKFDNPLYRNRAREAAVRALAPGSEVRGLVVFTDAGRFPRQRPAGVHMLAGLCDELGVAGATPPARLQSAWEALKQRVQGVPL